MSKPLCIWDLDGTMLDGQGAGHRALVSAAETVTGKSVVLESSAFPGRTDPQLFDAIADKLGLSWTALQRDAMKEQFLLALEKELRARPVKVLPHIAETLDELQRRSIGLTVATGNFVRGAHLKLISAGVDTYFKGGGFGEDGPERYTIVQAALDRAIQAGVTGPALVIGDTPLDVTGAHKVGLLCLGVATGRYSEETLSSAGADFTLSSFEDTDKFATILASLS